MTINILPDDVLLEIFDFYVDPTEKYINIEAWRTLVHVCRRWRNLVFESPLRLNLRLICHPKLSLHTTLDIWPPLFIVIDQHDGPLQPDWGVDNVIAALELNNRTRQICLWAVPALQMGEILTAMHKSFPALNRSDL